MDVLVLARRDGVAMSKYQLPNLQPWFLSCPGCPPEGMRTFQVKKYRYLCSRAVFLIVP